MGQIDGFMKFDREMPKSRDPKERLKITRKYIRRSIKRK